MKYLNELGIRKKIALFVIAAVCAGLFFVPYSTYTRLVANFALSFVDEEQIKIQAVEPHAHLLGLNAKSVWVRPVSSPFSIVAKNFEVSLLFSSLFKGRIEIEATAEVYEGIVTIRFNPLSNSASLVLERVELSQFPPLLGLGFQSLLATGEVRGFNNSNETTYPVIEEFNLNFSNIDKPVETSLPSRFTQLPIPIVIPPFTKGSIRATGTSLDGKTLKISEFNGKSSLVSFKSSGAFTEDPNSGKPTVELVLKGKLTKSGHKQFGTPLKLFSNGKVSKAAQPFRISVLGPLRPAPKVSITALEASEE